MTSDDNSKAALNLKILLLQRKGGRTSARIIEKLLERPYNPNQIAELLGVSYNTAYYHMQIMKKYGLIEKKTNNYGSLYEPTDALLSQKELFYKLKELI
ncbi:MAG: winged helix-turn-helix transcriptional regulator [Methanobrevibacter sp.]|uniref:ArsR/SmtB family transcription factor n=1 Tax=Methanobrevibacter sp. TaxID=66852 RepID=UPI001B015BA7|nr:winged helix-turn-helix domain-containing protein [Methanobrevibacter sp.]MBO5150594.1 winged helix-turn-helix transcriptional regulator [Methanobrevibacter sp.]